MEKYLNLEIEEANHYYWEACKNNNIEDAKLLLENYPDIDIEQSDDYKVDSAIKWVIRHNNREFLHYLLEEKDKKDKFLATHYKHKEAQISFEILWSIGETGNIDLLKYILDIFQDKLNKKGLKYTLETCLRAASSKGNLKLIKYLLLNDELEVKPSLSQSNYFPYQLAASGGYLEIIKFYLLSPDLKHKPTVSTYNHYAPRAAAWNNHFELLEYLLTNEDLKEKADIHACNDSYLFAAIRHENIEMLDFLLKSPKLKEHSDLHHKNDLAFRTAVKDNKILVLQYLICDYEIEKSEHINKAIKKRRDIQKMFEMGKLYKKLMNNLPEKTIKNKKEKI